MRTFLVVILVVAGAWFTFTVVGAYRDSQQGRDPASSIDAAWNDRFETLHDEAVQDVGWMAGNAKGHPLWAILEPHVGPGGDYYQGLMTTGLPGASQQAEASHNLQTYNAGISLGQAVRYDEADLTRRLKRVVQIIGQLTDLMKEKNRRP